MPGGDGTGPQGAGPMTGRGAGRCAGFAMPGYANRNIGRGGCGRGFGFGGGGGGGRGRRNWFYATGMPGGVRFGGGTGSPATAGPEVEKQALQEQARMLQEQLNAILQRIETLETGPVGK